MKRLFGFMFLSRMGFLFCEFLKRTRFNLIIHSFILSVVVSSSVFASQSIYKVTQQSNTLVISGLGFSDDQGTTTPLFWDNFESGPDGQNLGTQLAGSVKWETSGDTGSPSKYSSAVRHSGMQSAYKNYYYNNHWGTFTVGAFGNELPNSTYYYQTFWFRFNTPRPLGTAGTIKLVRIFGDIPTNKIPDIPYMKTTGVGKADKTTWWTTSYRTETAANEPYITWPTEPAENKWHRLEALYKQSSAGNVADGSIQILINGVSVANFQNIITRENSVNRWIKADFFPGMTGWDDNNTGLHWESWLDDAYLSKTWQRVEMCDSATWATRTHCELQPATAWVDNQITVALNTGSFTSGQKVYIYVVDSNGVVNANGFTFTLGATPPAPPKGNLIEKYIP